MIRVGSRVFHRVFGAGNVVSVHSDYAEVKFDDCGRRAIVFSALSERPFNKEKKIEKKRHGQFFEGQIVYHRKFGKGLIKEINDDNALVSFDEYGEKRIVYDFLSTTFIAPKIEEIIPQNTADVSQREKATKKIRISNLDVIECIINLMLKTGKRSMPFDVCVKYVREHLYPALQTIFIKLNALDPSNNTVFLTHLLKREAKIHKGYLSEIFVTFDQDALIKNKEEPKIIKEKNLEAFERACIKEPFNSTVKMYMARAIIHFCKNVKINKEKYYVYNLNDLSKDILKSFLYQVSVGRFKNETVREQPPFYSLIVYSVDDNHISPEEEKELIKLISHELSYYYINQFIKISNGVTNDIYIPYPDKIVFTREFVELIKEKGDSIESRVLYRLFYFLEKINDNLNAVKAYESNIRRGLDKEDFEYKFEYEKNLDQLKRSLTEDLYLKNYFKSLMKQYGIPSTEKYLRMCLDRIDYSLKTKQIILSSKYPTLKAYYKEEVLKNDIYRYSNPLNLDEYDTALKSLQYDLLLIEVGNGVYLTRVNMEKNGINEDVIRDFHNEIEKIGHELKYFSIKEIEEIMPGNPIVEYCNGDKKQLVQFIKPVPNIKIINIGKKGIILSFTNSKKYRGEFIEFIMGNRNKMDLYEIKDFVENTFDVEYSLDEIIKDVSQTTFYYSEEMEKVYKHKEDYIREVYYDGN